MFSQRAQLRELDNVRHSIESAETGTPDTDGARVSSSHVDHISRKGHVGIFHYDLFHRPIAILEAVKIPEAKAAVNKEPGKLNSLLAWVESKAKPKAAVVQMAEKEGRKNNSLCKLDGFVSSEERRACQEASKVSRVSCRAVFTEQGASASQSADREVGDAVSVYTQIKMIVITRFLSLEVWRRISPRQRPKTWSPSGRFSLEKCCSRSDEKKVPYLGMSAYAPRIRCSFRPWWTILRWSGKLKISDACGKV